MVDPKEAVLLEILQRRLGHARPWPAELARHVTRAAQEQGMEELEWLRGIEARADDWAGLVSAATVGHTSFYRHPEHFASLSEHAMLLGRRGRPVRVWSAGCASGEEAWSIAVCLSQLNVDFSLFASDVDSRAIARARTGSYAARETEGLPGCEGTSPFQAGPALQRRVRFEVVALGQSLPADVPRRFDIVFCRNVLIYFELARAAEVLQKLATHVAPDGALVLSPVEALGAIPVGFQRHGPLGWLTRGAALEQSVAAATRAEPSEAAKPPALTRPARPSGPTGGPFDVAAALVAAGELDAGETLLHQLLAQHDDAFGWFLLGEIFSRRGEKTQARIAFERSAKAFGAPPDMDLSTLRRAAMRRAILLGD